MKKTIYVIILFACIFCSPSCLFDEGCEELGFIDFSENRYPVSFVASSDTLRVNGVFSINIKVPFQMNDLDGDQHTILHPPDILIKFTDQETVEPLDTTNVFNLGGETLHATFNEHFIQNVKVGNKDNDLIFRYQSVFVDSQFELEIEYRIRKKGIYKVSIGYEENTIKVVDSPDVDCLDFSAPRLYWEENPMNQVFDYYDSAFDQSFRFVFEVK